GEENALRMHVVAAPCLLDGVEDVVLDQRVAWPVAAPTVAEPAVGALTNELLAAQAHTNIVAPAQPGSQAQDLLLVAAVAMEEDEQRIGVVRLIARRQERPHRQPAERLQLGRVEPFRGPELSP